MEFKAERAATTMNGTTEASDERYRDLDLLPLDSVLSAMNEAEMSVPLAVRGEIPRIAAAIRAISAGLKGGGRLIYIGAGTSGRLGVLDASECPPTFSSDPTQVVGLIAGGDLALRNAIEGAEDDADAGAATVLGLQLTQADTVVGIAASGRTPYVLGAIAAATQAGATTVGISNNSGSELSSLVDYPIEVEVGPEVLTGSTRLKAGSAQKQVLNMISTATMVQLGKTYGNLMVDVSASNDKLRQRALNLVKTITGRSDDVAEAALAEADGSVKVAAVAIVNDCSTDDARVLLDRHDGNLRAALEA
ncbi:N-acetylmuramic acid 6-phosphate etherase [Agromyces archimandritae]|uniref:N-acetylmuramic acid 6-phosphate etherase n=1 Tax=Agromyces archimandritae TaxID=2781962 RepID=A0A975FLE1_9MICO|nr:N-acetylmuramic acid 6-phosphate etherase [Agromyces archimandritae]QTX04079.1 N-acetylmuramic acid 6-phosphate etherase [Agromyces archimandritae]